MQTYPTTLAHKAAISDLVNCWALWRDSCDWAPLRACYPPGAHMSTTWFDGTATDFVEASIRAAAAGAQVQHLMFIPVTELAPGLDPQRAVAETRVELLVRGTLDGIVVDVHCWGRFHDRLVRSGDAASSHGGWRLQSRTPVYDKDRLHAVDPTATVRLDPARLAALPAHYAHLAYLQSAGGANINRNLPPANSPGHHALREDSRLWLNEQNPHEASA